MEKRILSGLLSTFSFFLLFISVFGSEMFYGNYSVRMPPYSGSSEIQYFFKGDSIILSMSSNVAFNTVKFTNYAAIDTLLMNPAYIISNYNMLGKKSRGEIYFDGNEVRMLSIKNGKTTEERRKGTYQMNDWLILPYFLSYVKDSIYKCSTLHGDLLLKKSAKGDTVIWQDDSLKMIVEFADGRFIYEKAGKITLKRKK